jgi:hypothetical protein
LKEKSFWRGLLYLFSFFFQLMLIPVVLYSLSSQLNIFQLILLMFCGFCNCFVFIRLLKVAEDKIAETETQGATPSFNKD